MMWQVTLFGGMTWRSPNYEDLVVEDGWPAMGLERGGRGVCFHGGKGGEVGLSCHQDTGGGVGNNQ
jgi:hypothetical protein